MCPACRGASCRLSAAPPSAAPTPKGSASPKCRSVTPRHLPRSSVCTGRPSMAIKGGIPKPPAPPPAEPSGQAFIDAAPGKEGYPWEAPHLRDDVLKQLNVDQPEKLLLQVDWLAGTLRTSKRKLVER